MDLDEFLKQEADRNGAESGDGATKPEAEVRSGYAAIIGRPNVGKSTLMNRILGQKVAITTHKPQTTRHRILGIKTAEDTQTVYVDTPGIHLGAKKAMNRYLNKAATSALRDVDVVLFVVEAERWTDEDDAVRDRLKNSDLPVVLVVNKVDQYPRKDELLPRLAELGEKGDFVEVFPVSATKGINVPELESTVARFLPNTGRFFPEDQITDRSERFLAAEIVREKLMIALEQELPYAITVEIEHYGDEELDEAGAKALASTKTGAPRRMISAVIWVEREGQKRIVIGKAGATLKEVGKRARVELSRLLNRRVHLELWVKVKSGWSDSDRALKSLGYDS